MRMAETVLRNEKFQQFVFGEEDRVLIVRMRTVPSLDATAMKQFELLHARCERKGVTLILSHVNKQPMLVMKRSGFFAELGEENFAANIDEALKCAEEICRKQ